MCLFYNVEDSFLVRGYLSLQSFASEIREAFDNAISVDVDETCFPLRVGLRDIGLQVEPAFCSWFSGQAHQTETELDYNRLCFTTTK